MDKLEEIKDFIVEHKIKFIIGISALTLLLLVGGFIYFYQSKESDTVVFEPVLEEKKREIEKYHSAG